MIARTAMAVCFLALAAGAAEAQCEHNGITYSVGATICTGDGWLQECTPAGYWKAVGMCKAPDQRLELTSLVSEGISGEQPAIE